MDLLILTAILVPGLAALGLGALRWGVDSRDPMPDDRRRAARGLARWRAGRGLAWISLACAAAAGWIDACLANDLRRVAGASDGR